jgi:hypothetical protein
MGRVKQGTRETIPTVSEVVREATAISDPNGTETAVTVKPTMATTSSARAPVSSLGATRLDRSPTGSRPGE